MVGMRMRTRRQIRWSRTVATLLAVVICLFQAQIAFISVKAEAWTIDNSSQGFIILMLLVLVLFAMVMSTAAMIVSPRVARILAIVAIAIDAVVVVIVLSITDDPGASASVTDAAIRLAAPVMLLGLASLVERLEGGHLR